MANVKQLTVNGARVGIDAEPDASLLEVLREELDLTGARYGCGEAQCGACTVLLDGSPIRSCVTAVGAVKDRKVVTVEGLAQGEKLHPLQQAFLEEDALQCGFCTCGMVMSAVGLLRRNPNPSDLEIRKALEGNICRCGVYGPIVAAVSRAAKTMRGGPR